MRSDKDVNSQLVTTLQPGDVVGITGDPETVGDYTWYPVMYGEYTGYMRSVNLTINSTYGGIVDVSPTLYRDTPLTLTWDYFGFNRNSFKPLGYGNGIYLWNPRSWDKDNVKFTFEELIRCGTQYVVYPIFNADTYKIWVQNNWVGSSRDITSGGHTTTVYMNNPGIKINMTNPDNPAGTKYLYSTPHYSIYAAGEWRNDLGYSRDASTISGYHYIGYSKNFYYNTRIGKTIMSPAYSLAYAGFQMPFGMIFGDTIEYNDITPDALKQVKNGDLIIGEYSNYRHSPTGIVGIGNAYENREIDYYAYGSKVKIDEPTNLTNYHVDPPIAQSSIDNNQYNQEEFEALKNSALDALWCRGVIYEAIGYYDNMMIHYYVPVPKGLRYKYNGVDLRIPDNGLFDLLTGEFASNFIAADNPYSNQNTLYPAGFNSATIDGKGLIFLRNQQINEADAYDVFTEWQYTTSNVFYLLTISNNTTITSYKACIFLFRQFINNYWFLIF